VQRQLLSVRQLSTSDGPTTYVIREASDELIGIGTTSGSQQAGHMPLRHKLSGSGSLFMSGRVNAPLLAGPAYFWSWHILVEVARGGAAERSCVALGPQPGSASLGAL